MGLENNQTIWILLFVSLFLNKLKNVSDPEKKRKIIGNLFIKFFEENDNAKERLTIYSCTSGYPVPFKDVALLEINNFRIVERNELLNEKKKSNFPNFLANMYKEVILLFITCVATTLGWFFKASEDTGDPTKVISALLK